MFTGDKSRTLIRWVARYYLLFCVSSPKNELLIIQIPYIRIGTIYSSRVYYIDLTNQLDMLQNYERNIQLFYMSPMI